METTRNLRPDAGGNSSRNVAKIFTMFMGAMLMATMTIKAQNLTLPQLEYRLKNAEHCVECTQDRLEDAQDLLKDQQEKLQDLMEEKNELVAKQQKMERKIKAATADEVAELNQEKTLLVAELKRLQQKIADATVSQAKAREKAELLKKKYLQKRQNLEATKAKLKTARKNTPEIIARKKLDLAEDFLDRAEDELKKAAKHTEKVADNWTEANRRRTQLTQQANAQKQKIAATKAELNKAKTQRKQLLQQTVKAQEAELLLMNQKLENVKKAEQQLKEIKLKAEQRQQQAAKNLKNAQKKLADAKQEKLNAKKVMEKDQENADAEQKQFILARKKAHQERARKELAQRQAQQQALKEQQAKAAKATATAATATAATATATAETKTFQTPWTPAPERELPVLQGDKRITVPQAQDARVADPKATLPQFDVTMVSGDKEIVEKMQIWKDWSAFVVFNKVTPKQVNEFHGQLLKALREEGYVFAQVTFPTRIWSTGIFLAKVDLGVLGNITVKNQKYYSAEQIADALKNREGRFNYAKVHSDLFDLNVKPDLKLNTQLSTAMINGRRVINADINVNDKLPIHGAIELTNTGSKDSDSDWRIRATLQHLNLTRHGDSLTIDYLTGGDVADNLNAFSASYFLPVDDKNHVNVYAGYNANYADDVLPEIAVRGKGFFGGFAWTHTLYENVRERVELSLGWYYHRNEEHIDLTGEKLDNGDMVVSMPTITLGYSSKIYDRWNGRNFASISLKQNRAGTFGASSKEDFIEASTTDGDFFIASLSAARFQRLFAGQDHPGKWTLYAKANAQMASDDLPTIMRDYIGGQNSVRGYEESELGGDNSFVGSLELRTPLVENFIPGLKKDDPKFFEKYPEHWSMHRLQFVAFTDFGYVSEKHKEKGEDDQGFWSVGAGIRLGVTKYAQMALDYGLPLIDASDNTPEAGRFHISLQLQF